jgi:hypothetical protein
MGRKELGSRDFVVTMTTALFLQQDTLCTADHSRRILSQKLVHLQLLSTVAVPI